MKTRQLLLAAMAWTLVLAVAVPAFANHGRLATGEYESPAVGQGDILSVCFRLDPPLNSCVEEDPEPGETHVGVTIRDANASPVYGTVGQIFQGTWLWSENFCGTTLNDFPNGIPIQDQILGQPIPVIVFPHSTPGLDPLCVPEGGLGATQGEVDFRF